MNPALHVFKPADLLLLKDRESSDSLAEAYAVAQVINGESWAFTAVIDDEVIGCAGVFKRWEGTGQAWVMISHQMIHHRIWFHKCVRRLLFHVKQAGQLQRIEAVVKSDSAVNMKWITSLGFRNETPLGMAKYRPEGDYYLYAMIGE